jgi:sterol desaturase/sphingolipid hydroxylase (fatty acid hydroxylase superfamily)
MRGETSQATRKIATTDRDELRRWIPKNYSPIQHVLGIVVAAMAGITFVLVRNAPHVRPIDLVAVPLTLAFATLLEYVAHRWLMHVPRPNFRLAWEAHTGRHHHFYVEESATWEQLSDIWLILFSAIDVVVLVAIVAGPYALLRLVLPTGAWALVVATSCAFFLSYELLHLTYHLPAEHPLLRNRIAGRWLTAMRAHHLRHHRLSDMDANFGVTTRLWDRVFDTTKEWDRASEKAAA